MIEKPTGVFPALEWVDYSDNDRGVSILNQGIPSHEIRDQSIYLTLLRSVVGTLLRWYNGALRTHS